MRYLRIIFILMLSLITLETNAKVKVGIEVMPQLSTRLSWSIGANLEIPVSEKMFFATGAFYSTRHRYSESLIQTMEYHPDGLIPTDYEKVSLNIHANCVNIPVLIGFQNQIGTNNAIKVAGGLYYAYYTGGKSKLQIDNNGEVDEEIWPSLLTAINKRSDIGLSIEVKYLLHEHYQIGINLQHGLVKLYQGFEMAGLKDPMATHSLTPGVKFHQSIGLSLGYLF